MARIVAFVAFTLVMHVTYSKRIKSSGLPNNENKPANSVPAFLHGGPKDWASQLWSPKPAGEGPPTTESNDPRDRVGSPKVLLMCLNPENKDPGHVTEGPAVAILAKDAEVTFLDPSFGFAGNHRYSDMRMWDQKNATLLKTAELEKRELNLAKTDSNDLKWLLAGRKHSIAPLSCDMDFHSAMQKKWGALKASFDYVVDVSCPVSCLSYDTMIASIQKALKPGGVFVMVHPGLYAKNVTAKFADAFDEVEIPTTLGPNAFNSVTEEPKFYVPAVRSSDSVA